jgi:hypothetical protein
MKSRLFLIVLAGFFSSAAKGIVTVYNAPDSIMHSREYMVEIFQNEMSHKSFVYTSNNKFADKLDAMTDFNHWTTFSFSGAVTVKITKRNGFVGGAKVYPLSLGIEPVIQGKTLTFTLQKPAKLYIEMLHMDEHPLFVFADEPEMDVPDKSDPNVIWFDEGQLYNVGEKFPVKSGQTVYVEGGAWVYGTFALEENAKNVTIKGRGVISSEKLGRRPNSQNIPVSTIYGPGTNGNCIIEGITITDPAHFCIITYIPNQTRNVKLFGWWYQTDGWGGGDNSTLEDAFIKVNDDNVKVYRQNQKISNLIIYQQLNGAPFQLSWGNHAANNCTVDGVEIVKCFVPYDSRPGNGDLINLRHHGKGEHIYNLRFSNITANRGVYRILGLNNDRGGKVENIVLENFSIDGGVMEPGYIINTGKIEKIKLKNVRVDGRLVGTDDFTFEGADKKVMQVIQ